VSYAATVLATQAAGVAASATAIAESPGAFTATLSSAMAEAAERRGLEPPQLTLLDFAEPAVVILEASTTSNVTDTTDPDFFTQEVIYVIVGCGVATCCLCVSFLVGCALLIHKKRKTVVGQGPRKAWQDEEDDGMEGDSGYGSPKAWKPSAQAMEVLGLPSNQAPLAAARIPEAPPGAPVPPPPPPLPYGYVAQSIVRPPVTEAPQMFAESHFWHWAQDFQEDNAADRPLLAAAPRPRRGPILFVDEATGRRTTNAPVGTWGQGWRGEVEVEAMPEPPGGSSRDRSPSPVSWPEPSTLRAAAGRLPGASSNSASRANRRR
jgi:hypothetical protein